ncbi:MAG TPA: helix-turn-helix transcriptional regulator [Candidatus Dormibacteraeota bacterium]
MIRLRSEQLRLQAAIRGWDQRQLARRAGISEATVSRALAGHGVRRRTLLQLARALSGQQPLPELEDLVTAAREGE